MRATENHLSKICISRPPTVIQAHAISRSRCYISQDDWIYIDISITFARISDKTKETVRISSGMPANTMFIHQICG